MTVSCWDFLIKTYHLEFTQHKDKIPLLKPTKENLMVLYLMISQNIKKPMREYKKQGFPRLNLKTLIGKVKARPTKTPGWLEGNFV